MTVTSEQENKKLTMHISGRLDTITAPELKKEIDEISPEITELILDITDVDYVSSAGLRTLLSAHKKMSSTGSMKITGVCDVVMEVLEMTGFSDILTIE